jgi:hypothetical protein
MTIITSISAQQYTDDYINNQSCTPIVDLETFLKPCFIVSKDDNCTIVTIDDKTDYSNVDINDVTIQVALEYSYSMNTEQYEVCPTAPYTPDSKVNFPAMYGNGKYTFTIVVTYIDPNTLTEYTKVYEECITLGCCECDIQDLIEKIRARIPKIGCKINDYELIGRKTINLYNDLYALTNALFFLETSIERNYCEDAELVTCFLKSIKNYC